MFDLSQHFHAYVLTLEGWEQRLEKFMARANEIGVVGFEVLYGVGGKLIGKPNWWKSNARKWACNLAHLNAVHRGIMANAHGDRKPIMILEDDAHLRRNFIESVQEVAAFYRDHDDATVCYLGGRVHQRVDQVSRLVWRAAKVGGGYAYTVSADHARALSQYFMNDPRNVNGRFKYAQDTKMMRRCWLHRHATVFPVCVGHNGGPSILLQRRRGPRHVDD